MCTVLESTLNEVDLKILLNGEKLIIKDTFFKIGTLN
jgi:hypothetical protein